jgi:hypothetical protein
VSRSGQAAVLWIISGDQELNVLAVDPEALGIPVPADVAALAECFWGEGAVILVTTKRIRPARQCETLFGTVTAGEAALVETALAQLVS